MPVVPQLHFVLFCFSSLWRYYFSLPLSSPQYPSLFISTWNRKLDAGARDKMVTTNLLMVTISSGNFGKRSVIFNCSYSKIGHTQISAKCGLALNMDRALSCEFILGPIGIRIIICRIEMKNNSRKVSVSKILKKKVNHGLMFKWNGWNGVIQFVFQTHLEKKYDMSMHAQQHLNCGNWFGGIWFNWTV